MPISINCPKCKAHYDLPDKAANTDRKCFRCGATFKVVPGQGGAKVQAAPKPAAKSAVSEDVIETGASGGGGAAKYAIIAVVISVVGIGGFFAFRGGKPEEKKETKQTTQLGTTVDERLLSEAKQRAEEAKKFASVKSLIQYGQAVDVYREIVTLQGRIQANGRNDGGKYTYSKPTLTEADKLVSSRRTALEDQFKAYLVDEADKASSVDELLSQFSRPDLPELREFVLAAVHARKPQLLESQTITSLLNLIRQGRAEEATEAERASFVSMAERGSPEVKALFTQAADEIFKLYTGDEARAKRLDAALAKHLEAVADDQLFHILAVSSCWRTKGAITVPGRSGPESVRAPELYALTVRLWKKFGPTLDVMRHVSIVRTLTERGNRETWGDLDPVILGGRTDPKYFADFFVQLTGAVPDQPPDAEGKLKSIPYHKYLKQAITGMNDDHITTLLDQTKNWRSDCINAAVVVEALVQNPTPKAIPALLALHRQPGSVSLREVVLAVVKCYDVNDRKASSQVDSALNEWVATDPNVQETIQLFLKEGKSWPVVKILMNVLDSGNDQAEKWFRLADDILSKDPKLANDLVPALVRSYSSVKGDSPARKSMILKYKAPAALVDAVQMYPRMQDPSVEFVTVLRALLDKRAAKFLKWAAFVWTKRPAWAVEELRRVTGENGPLDVKHWDAWFSKNADKLGPQIEGFEVMEDPK